MIVEAQPCALYRHFDELGTLLYIGTSVEPHSRTGAHVAGSEWVQFARRGSVEWHPSVEAAVFAEALAIRSEGPVFNRVHALGDPDARISEYHARRRVARAEPRRRTTSADGLVTLHEASLTLRFAQGQSALKALMNGRDRDPKFPQPVERPRGRAYRYDPAEMQTWVEARGAVG